MLYEKCPFSKFILTELIMIDRKDIIIRGKDMIIHGKDMIIHGKYMIIHGKYMIIHGKDMIIHGKDMIIHGQLGNRSTLMLFHLFSFRLGLYGAIIVYTEKYTEL